MASRIVATPNFKPSVTSVDDRVRIAIPGIGLVVYGDTHTQALERLDGTIDLLVSDLVERGGMTALTERLSRGGLMLVDDGEINQQQIVGRVESRVLALA